MMVTRVLQTRFGVRRRRAWRMSLWLSFAGHGMLAALLFWTVVTMASGVPEARDAGVAGTRAEPEPQAPMEMVWVAEETMLPGAPRDLDPATWRARLRTGAQDASKQSPASLMSALDSLLGQAAGIDDKALDDIGVFLGNKPDAYKVRTYYKDELNRNANLAESSVVRAFAFTSDTGDGGYTITLRDREKDEYTFTLEKPFSAPLAERRLRFGDETLPSAADGEPFDLQGAVIAGIDRWKREDNPNGLRGAVVRLVDPAGREVLLHLEGQRYEPFYKERMRFVMRARGMAQDEGTLHTAGFDFDSATLLPPSESDVLDGDELRVRKILLDKNGERLILVLRGEEAREYLEQMKALENPVARKIYERIGMQLLPGMARDAEEARQRENAVREKRTEQK